MRPLSRQSRSSKDSIIINSNKGISSKIAATHAYKGLEISSTDNSYVLAANRRYKNYEQRSNSNSKSNERITNWRA